MIYNFSQFVKEEFYGGIKTDYGLYFKFEKLVDDLLKQHIGGRQFFDALDEQIKTVMSEEIILNLVENYKDEYLVSSGGFGDIAYKMFQQGKIKCKDLLIFNGKIATENKEVVYFYPENFDISNKEFVYIDDSYFSGKTVNKINDFLNKNNSNIKEVAVVYNGSSSKNDFVKSIYRYYE